MEEDYVYEMCPNCEHEIEMIWDVRTMGYRAFCPVCGKPFMLCNECLHPDGEFNGCCDYDSRTDTCKLNKKED